ncbi:hypothetical protein [Spongiibacter thalassae]|uniref:hypothetical protein n=1 Tax=Spongiibacter thalassae TaxID=2721624 RepID=UPI001B2FEE66|nr:hypothetical protein [Spongiibacter thalassae]
MIELEWGVEKEKEMIQDRESPVLNNANRVGADVREVLLSLGDRGAMPYKESRVQQDIQRIIKKWPIVAELNGAR